MKYLRLVSLAWLSWALAAGCNRGPASAPSGPLAAAAAPAPGKADDPRKRASAIARWFGPQPTAAQRALRRKQVSAERKRVAPSLLLGAASTTTTTVGAWTNLGPRGDTSTVSPDIDAGRLSGIVLRGSNVFVASPGGGVMRTLSAQVDTNDDWSWQSITDSLDTSSGHGGVAVGAMLAPLDGRDVVYIGLGDYRDQSIGGEVYKGSDVSTDSPSWTSSTLDGASFVLSMGMLTVRRFGDGAIIYLDTLFVGTDQGLFMGLPSSLSRVTSVCSTCQVWSVQTDGQSQVVVSARKSNNQAVIYYSSDSGTTWTKATFDQKVNAKNPQRITLAMSPTDSNKVWGLAADTSGNTIQGVLVSTDKGQSWTFKASTGLDDGLQFADSNQVLTVSPDGTNTLFFGTGGALYRSTDGGGTFTQIADDERKDGPYLHTDLHAAAWWNTTPSGSSSTWALLVASDGGIGIFRDPFRAQVPQPVDGKVPSDTTFLDNRRNTNLAILQAYNIGSTAASNATALVAAGSQDNGTRLRVTPPGGTLSTSAVFTEVANCGDGFGTLLHPSDGNQMLAACESTRIYKSTNALGTKPSFTEVSGNIEGAGDDTKAPFFTKLVPGGSDTSGKTVYTAVNRTMYKSTDFGSTWNALGMGGYGDHDIRNFAAAASDGSVLAIVAEDDTVYLSTDSGGKWSQLTAARSDSSGSLSAVWFDTTDAKTLYVASVSLNPSASHLWKSTDQGSSFTAIDPPNGGDNGFPLGTAVHVILNNPTSHNDLFAGTDLGVYRSTDGGASWTRFGQGLPMVAVTDLYITPSGSLLRAATFGRGLWEAPLTE